MEMQQRRLSPQTCRLHRRCFFLTHSFSCHLYVLGGVCLRCETSYIYICYTYIRTLVSIIINCTKCYVGFDLCFILKLDTYFIHTRLICVLQCIDIWEKYVFFFSMYPIRYSALVIDKLITDRYSDGVGIFRLY